MIKRESETFQEELEDTNAVIRSRKSKNYRLSIGQNKKEKGIITDIQDTSMKSIKDKSAVCSIRLVSSSFSP
jgi:hypothetical protein